MTSTSTRTLNTITLTSGRLLLRVSVGASALVHLAPAVPLGLGRGAGLAPLEPWLFDEAGVPLPDPRTTPEYVQAMTAYMNVTPERDHTVLTARLGYLLDRLAADPTVDTYTQSVQRSEQLRARQQGELATYPAPDLDQPGWAEVTLCNSDWDAMVTDADEARRLAAVSRGRSARALAGKVTCGKCWPTAGDADPDARAERAAIRILTR